MKKSYLVGLTYSFAAGAIFGGLLLIFGRQFLSLFATEPAVIDAGMQRVKIMGFSYMISAFMDCSIAASRGIGKSIVPMVIVILGSCVFRVIWVYTILYGFIRFRRCTLSTFSPGRLHLWRRCSISGTAFGSWNFRAESGDENRQNPAALLQTDKVLVLLRRPS